MGVGCDVGVGTGVFSSMVGGWSPTTGGSLVGRVENMPDGGVGDGPGFSADPPQAIIVSSASRAKAAAPSPKKATDTPYTVFELVTSKFFESHFPRVYTP